MADEVAEAAALVDDLVADQAEAWDKGGLIPEAVLRKLGASGLLCAQVPVSYGGRGLTSSANGRLTAHVGSRCSSVRSVMTSAGMAAWTIQRLGSRPQHEYLLPQLTAGELAAVGFSEPGAGSDLAAMATQIRDEGDHVTVTGQKVWVTGAYYADWLVIFGRYAQGGAAAVIPRETPGVHIERVADPLGCRAAGHANIRLDEVKVPAGNVLGGPGQSLSLAVTAALGYGRISVAWGCVGILRACLSVAASHARSREQFGRPLAEHQLIARHLADLLTAEQLATRVCEDASRHWDTRSPDLAMATVLAKYVSSSQAARASGSAVQVLASVGARDGHIVARAFRDAKLMEIIEGSTEICQLILAGHALARAA